MEEIDYKQITNETFKEIGKVNILIAGKTGVGKSTLLNTVFGCDLAKTGVGKPVTQDMKEYTKDGSYYHLYDTKGFELANYQEMAANIKQVISAKRTSDPSEHIHIAWYCINAHSNRYEAEELEFMKSLSDEIPVVLVCTQCVGENASNFYNKLKSELFNTKIHLINVLALAWKVDDDYTKPPFGVNELIDLTYELLPEAAKGAFAAAQKVNKEVTKKKVTAVIAGAASAAAAAGAAPIPFSDAIVLAPIQIGMIAKISAVYGLNFDSAFLSTLVTSAAGVGGAIMGGRAIVSGLLKLIPGAGSVIGGTIAAATAGTLTTAMGWAYYKALTYLDDNEMEMTSETISKQFKNTLSHSNSI